MDSHLNFCLNRQIECRCVTASGGKVMDSKQVCVSVQECIFLGMCVLCSACVFVTQEACLTTGYDLVLVLTLVTL